jgi:hypothetical protein
MLTDFSNRVQAQREMVKLVNSRAWPVEQLFALSEGAINRWRISNNLSQDSELVSIVIRAGEALGFLANESQQQISDEYKRRNLDFQGLLESASNYLAATSPEHSS